jgi:hypothetical protein
MMDAKPLAEDAAQRVMCGFVSGVAALILPQEQLMAMAAFIKPTPEQWGLF